MELPHAAGGSVCGTTFWKMVWHFPLKLNVCLFYVPGILLLRNEDLCPPEGMYVNAHRSFIHNSPKLEASHMFVHSGMEKLCHIQATEYYKAMIKDEVWLTTTTWVNLTGTMISRHTYLWSCVHMNLKNRSNQSKVKEDRREVAHGRQWVLA